ncbi:MAG: alanine racemase [Chloroflexi bacterium]|nr:alanine racemase [Chloroflexota bacterium]
MSEPLSIPEGAVTWAEVNLPAYRANLRAIQTFVGPRVQIFAVVKANAYGHGLVPMARAALQAGARRLVVHRLDEALQLRASGIQAPILILGYVPLAAARWVAQHRLTPTVITLEFLEALSAHTPADAVSEVHINVDTGMGRYGLLPDEVVPFLRAAASIPRVRIEGIYTHFATADEADRTYMLQQWRVFQDVLTAAEAAGVRPPVRHACNSAAIFALPEAHLDAVRPGIATYGLRPSLDWETPIALQPVLTWKARVARVRTLPPGHGIGYGRTYVTSKPTTVALVPVGYGDGYHRILSNKGQVLIHGQRAPVLGRVSMDQIVVNVSHIPNVALEDEVVLLGQQGGEAISAEELAAWAQTINYEVVTAILPRVPRIYLDEAAP